MSEIVIIEEVHQEDIGTIIEVTVKNGSVVVDISAATTLSIFLKKPVSATVLTKTGVLTTDGTDGKMQYTTISGDLDEEGVWQIQGYVVTAAGEWRTNIKDMSVFSNLA